MKLGLKRKIVLVFIGVLVAVTVLDALLASYFTNRQNQDAAFATLKRDLLTWQDELQDTTVHMRTVALSAIGETVALNQLSVLTALEYKLADALDKNKEVKEAARTLAFSKSVSLNRLHLVLRTGGFSAIAVYIDGKLSHQVSVSEVGMFVQRSNGARVWVKAAADGNGNLPLRSWPAWEEGVPPAVVDSLASVDRPQVAFTYPSADSMLIEVAVPVEGVIEQSLQQGEGQPPELSVIDPGIAGSASDPSLFATNRPPSPFAVVVFQKRVDQDFLQAVERKTGMWPLLFSPDGQHSRQMGPLNLSLQELLPDLAKASAGIKAKTVSTGQGSFYAAALPWQFEQQPGFVLALVASQDSTLQNIRQTVAAILTVTSLILALSIGIGIFWVGRFIDPIIALTNAVKAIGLVSRLERDRQSDYRLTAENLRPLAIQAPGEIGDLAWAFDVMIGELHHSFDSLEQRVEERTAELRALHQVLEEQNLQLEEQSFELGASNSSLLEEIGERKLIEDLLRLREQEFRSLAENSPDNIARYDRDGRIKYMNSQLHAALGLDEATARAAIGKKSTELYPDGDFDAYEQTIKSVIESGQVSELEVVLPDTGDGIRYHWVRMVAEREPFGEVIGVLALGRDITETRALQQRQTQYFAMAPGLFSTIEHRADGCYAMPFVSDGVRELFGLEPEEVMRDIGTLVARAHPDDIEMTFRKTEESERDLTPFHVEYRIIHPSNGLRWIECNSMPQRLPDGGTRWMGFYHDVTERKAIENALQDSEQMLQEAQRIAHVGSWDVDMVNDKLVWSDEIFRIWEIDKTKFKADFVAFLETVHPEDRDRVSQAYNEAVINRSLYEVEHRLLFPDGRVKHVLERGEPQYDAQGKPVRFIGTSLDITERKAIEKQLALLNYALDHVKDTVLLTGEDAHFYYVNKEACTTLGYSYDEMLGLGVPNIDPVYQQDHWPDHWRDLKANGSLTFESRHRTKDGRIFPVEINANYFEFDGQGYNLALARDISERKQMEDALRKNRQILTEAQRIAHVGSWEMDHVDNVLSWSDEIFRIFEVDPEQFGATYEAFLNAVHPYDRAAVERAYTESLKSREPYEIEHRLLMADGRVKYVLERCETAYADDGKPLNSLGTVQDITERKRMEAELISQTDFQQTILNAVADAGMQVMMIEEGRIIHVGNRKLAYEFGFTDEDIDTHPALADIIHPDDRDRIIDYHVRRMAGEAVSASYELGLVTRNGERREYETSVAIVPGTDPVRVITVGKDISERKRMETELLSQADFQKTIINAVCDVGMQLIVIENGRMIHFGNQLLARKFGFTDEDIDGYPSFIDFVHPDDRARVIGYHVSRMKGEAAPNNYELGLVAGNGERREYETSVAVVPDTDPVRLIAIFRDITERKRMEEALANREQELCALNASLELRVLERTEELRQQTRYLRTMIDTLPMFAWLKDTDSRFLVVNQALAAACSHNVDELVGKSDLDVWPREHAETYRADDAEVMATGQRKAVEEPFVDARDGAIWVETFKAPVVDEDGRVLGTVGVSRDISERKAVEAAREAALVEAERLARLRSEFMARMSHELRTPLNGILGYSQILLGENRLNERQHVMVNVMQQSGEHLLSLINDILDFAKIEAGKQELSLSDIHLPSFLHNLADIVSVKAEQKQLAFICDIAAAVPEGIRADDMRLKQVLLNLLSNAVKYSEQGQISLRVTVLKKPFSEGAPVELGRLRFEIQDSGIGIEAGQLESIFKPFEQAADIQYSGGGTGLGLVISRELVRLMGSEIFVSSRVGEGSTFWFDLDAPVVDVNGDIMRVEQHITGYLGPRQRVLVVDDAEVNRALLIDMLCRLGFETDEAANGRVCLDSVETRKPDLILLDMVMPEMGGLETARRLRQMPGFGQTPIVAVSAGASGIDVAEAMAAGVNVFLTKPIEIKRLMGQIAGLLKLDWVYALPKTEPSPKHKPDDWLDAPPLEEMRVLRQLAAEGSMRDIIIQADYLDELDASYRPFAEQLRSLAKGYQSKAVLDLVERYIDRNCNYSAPGFTDEH
ncbi:PAS domain S-box protein [Methylobacter tundripaludum]|uniref:histidine kinase n=1 Tax=Methylobacter tundripaludum (strain ATCC BAA-1195 / DSM 17260 / SV96) TaxID=697282 RepID=G3IVE2_METTV|nr:PAS domain S-box protein [Methylobacter tundripaludum]EGW22869.1 multi-sensor hybrid histidine kinase [Methylobacter tundripaludum SV96]